MTPEAGGNLRSGHQPAARSAGNTPTSGCRMRLIRCRHCSAQQLLALAQRIFSPIRPRCRCRMNHNFKVAGVGGVHPG